MKKMKLLVAVAVAGLLGLSAHAAPSANFSPVKIKLTALVQAPDTGTSTIKFNVTKIKITNKEVLGLVEDEYGDSFPAGAQLVVDNFWDGLFSVLDKDGAILRADASNGVGDDAYELYIGEIVNRVFTGSGTDTKETFKYTMVGNFFYQDSVGQLGGGDFFGVTGFTTVNDSFNFNSETSKESFKLEGAGNGRLSGDNAVVSGKVSGSGKNNVLPPPS